MKKILIATFTFFLQLMFVSNIFAQQLIVAPTPGSTDSTTNTTDVTSNPSFEYFTVEVFTKPQSAWSRNVPIYVKFVATIDSDKVQITWDPPYGIDIIPKHPKFIAVKAGQTYQYMAEIKPKIAGSYNIAANVIAWQYNTNYTSSGNTFIKFSDSLLTDPVSTSYQLGIVFKWVILFVVLIILGVIAYIYAIKSKKKFDKWFNLPD